MRTASAKRWIALGLFLIGAVAVAVGLVSLGLVTEKTATGADPSDAFNEIAELPPAFDELVTWLPDRELARPVEPATRRRVEAAWVRSFEHVDQAQRSGDRAGTDAWFVGDLRDQAAGTARSEQPATLSQNMHELEVTFYSVDGSVIGLRATSELERALHNGPSLRSTDEFDAVLLLSDGNWRLQHLQRH